MGARRKKRWSLVDVDPARRIYVNRNLRLASIRAIGFDMDHTLAQYDPQTFETLAFEKARAKLIACGYPRSLKGARHESSRLRSDSRSPLRRAHPITHHRRSRH